MKTTKAMRDRLAELARRDGTDDYDRVVIMLLDDFGAAVEALKFYARHEHWMGHTDSSVAETILIAGKGKTLDGWCVAEEALREKP